MVARFGLLAVMVVAAAFCVSGSQLGETQAATLPHVTLFGDSIAEALVDYVPARRTVADGLDVDFEVAPCRRIAQLSCPYNGVRPPNVLDVVNTLGSKVGPYVVVAVGYNDFEDQYAQNISDALDAFAKVGGVKRVLWVTLRAARHPYVTMNDAIVAAAAKHPEMLVVDWNLYSRSHPEWFQDDGIHLNSDGALALATLLHTTLAKVTVPSQKPAVPVRVSTKRLPAATTGKAYAAKLAATGGRKPYFWSLPKRLPKGLRLRPTGWIGGVPHGRPGTFGVTVRVRDAAGSSATRRLRLTIRS